MSALVLIPHAQERVSLLLNRNFMNIPLARDTRAISRWFEGSVSLRWMTNLPGEDRRTHRVRLSVPANASTAYRRCPSAFDMNILFQLLARAQEAHASSWIHFASFAGLLRQIGVSPRDRERKRVKDSLAYFSELSIHWPRWYANGNHIPLTLPPPVTDVRCKGNSFEVRLHREWFNIARCKSYYVPLPLPLPSDAATQNFVLLTLTRPRK